jgi:hypothetical protein
MVIKWRPKNDGWEIKADHRANPIDKNGGLI